MHPLPSDPAFIGHVFPHNQRRWKIHEKTAHKNAKMAWIWRVGAEVRDVNKPLEKSPYWLCLRCWKNRTIYIKGTTSTTPAIQHMLVHHQVTENGSFNALDPTALNPTALGPTALDPTALDPTALDPTALDPTALDPTAHDPTAYDPTALRSIERPPSFSNLVTQVSVTAMNQALITWVILAHIALSCVESDSFRAFIQLLNPALFEYLYRSGASIKVLILKDFEKRKERVRQALSTAKSKIHISFDLWTSNNSLAMLGTVAHYLDKSLVSRSLIIALRELKGDHSGLNQSKILASVIREFEIQDRIGYFISDNATSNDFAVFHTCEELKLADFAHRRLRCLGHIINLAAKAFLFGTDSGSFDFEISEMAKVRLEVRQALEILAFWRKKGPIGKLHNIIIWTSRSPQRTQAFKSLTYDFPEVRDSEPLFQHQNLSSNQEIRPYVDRG
jgi:hypothetical protein